MANDLRRDFANEDLSSVMLDPLQFRKPCPQGLVFSGEGFFTWLNKTRAKTHLWVMTYTASMLAPLDVPVSKLIVEIGEFPADEVRRCKQHNKLYIQWQSASIVGCYVGSQNLVSPTNTNLMIRVPKETHKWFKEYFQHYWKQSTKNVK